MKPNGFISDSTNFIRILDIKALPSRTDLIRKGIYHDLVSGMGSPAALQDLYYIAESHARDALVSIDADRPTDQEEIQRLLLPDAQCHNYT